MTEDALGSLLLFMVQIAAAFAVLAWMSTERHRKRFQVMEPLTPIRSKLLDVMLASPFAVSRREYEAASFLFAMTHDVLRCGYDNKAGTPTFRGVNRTIEGDLRFYRQTRDAVFARLDDLPDTPIVRKAYTDFIITLTDDFLVNIEYVRPHIFRAKVVLLFNRGLAKRIADTLRESDKMIHDADAKLA